jgi:hypothetical protein
MPRRRVRRWVAAGADERDAAQRLGLATRGDLGEAEHRAPEAHDVAVGEVLNGDTAPVDEGAVAAAIVEDARTLPAHGEDRVAPRDLGVLEPHVGDESAPDVGDRSLQRDQLGLAVVLEGQVAAGRGAGLGDETLPGAMVQEGVGINDERVARCHPVGGEVVTGRVRDSPVRELGLNGHAHRSPCPANMKVRAAEELPKHSHGRRTRPVPGTERAVRRRGSAMGGAFVAT